jgi:hypothetical protein
VGSELCISDSDQVYRQKVQEYVAYWYGNVKDSSKIEDMRGNMF